MSSAQAELASNLLDSQQRNSEKFVQLVCDLVALESPSLDSPSQKPVLDHLAREFEALDYRVRRLPGQSSGGHLLAYPRTRQRGQPFQLLIGHCDTVWPIGTLSKMPLRVDDGWIHGPGVYDMKAGLAMILFALQTLRDLQLSPPLAPVILINSDEEIGSFESRRHIERLSRSASRALVLEPSLGTEGLLKTARKGVGAFQVTVTGEAAHAGLEPDRGASAILELSYVIQQLFALSDPATGTTVNVGMIDGGVRPNVVAPQSKARVDVRVLSAEEGRRVVQAIAAIRPTTPGVQVDIEGGIGRPPMEFTPRNQALWETAKELGRTVGLELANGVAGGGSDGNTSSLYTATLDGLGAVGRGAHAVDEAIEIAPTLDRTALLSQLLLAEVGRQTDET